MKEGSARGWIAIAVTTATVVFLIVLVLVKLLWSWIAPDLFPGAVEQGLVAGTITWWTSAKVAIFFAIFTGFLRGHYEISGLAKGLFRS